MLDILTAQRMCVSFRDVVTNSIALRRKLFFVADAPPELWIKGDSTGAAFQRVDSTDAAANSNGNLEGRERRTLATLNPLLDVDRPRPPGGEGSIDQQMLCEAYTLCKLQRDLPGIFEASWRKMYLCDPPVADTGTDEF